MKLQRVAITFPSGNPTAVVFDDIQGQDRASLNKAIVDAWEKKHATTHVEQCCVITKPTSQDALCRVEMFGGEFCGNATRAAIHLLTNGDDTKGTIEVSGSSRPLIFEVKGGVIEIEMPLGRSNPVTKVPEGYIVHLEGITHLVILDAKFKTETPRDLLARILKSNMYGFYDEPASAVTFFDEDTGTATFTVWVKAIDTMFDETACGSGTASIGIALASRNQEDLELQVAQPTGVSIATRAHYDSKNDTVSDSRIAGTVTTLYDGELEL